MTCADTPNAISFPASEDGATPSDSPAGPMTDLFGQALAPVNRSAPRGSSVAATMSATYGLRSSTSSASAALEQSLASRLQERLDSLGGTMWQQIWKVQVTPLRRRISAHIQSGLHTSGSGCTGWPTLNAGPQNDGDTTFMQRRAELKAKHGNGNGFGLNLGQAAQLAGWPTPRSADTVNTNETPEQWAAREAEMKAKNPNLGGLHRPLGIVAKLAGWPTAKGTDGEKGARTHRGAMKELERKGPGADLPTIAAAAGWATPTTRDWKDGGSTLENTPVNALLGRQALIAGQTPSGSPAPTEKRGALNAELRGRPLADGPA